MGRQALDLRLDVDREDDIRSSAELAILAEELGMIQGMSIQQSQQAAQVLGFGLGILLRQQLLPGFYEETGAGGKLDTPSEIRGALRVQAHLDDAHEDFLQDVSILLARRG